MFNLFQGFNDCPDFSSKNGRKEGFYLMTHPTHFIYSYMASEIFSLNICIQTVFVFEMIFL